MEYLTTFFSKTDQFQNQPSSSGGLSVCLQKRSVKIIESDERTCPEIRPLCTFHFLLSTCALIFTTTISYVSMVKTMAFSKRLDSYSQPINQMYILSKISIKFLKFYSLIELRRKEINPIKCDTYSIVHRFQGLSPYLTKLICTLDNIIRHKHCPEHHESDHSTITLYLITGCNVQVSIMQNTSPSRSISGS